MKKIADFRIVFEKKEYEGYDASPVYEVTFQDDDDYATGVLVNLETLEAMVEMLNTQLESVKRGYVVDGVHRYPDKCSGYYYDGENKLISSEYNPVEVKPLIFQDLVKMSADDWKIKRVKTIGMEE